MNRLAILAAMALLALVAGCGTVGPQQSGNDGLWPWPGWEEAR